MLLDVNVLLYAADIRSPHHERAAAWLGEVLDGDRRVGIPWSTITAFVRIITHPRMSERPATSAEAWAVVQSWLDSTHVWIPTPSRRTAMILGDLLASSGATGNLVPDAALAALAVEHGLVVMTADTDFGRFPEARWHNPLTDA